MADLHPQMVAAHAACPGIGAQLVEAAVVVDSDIARALGMVAVHLHIAGDQQARATFRPAAIEQFMARRGTVLGISQTFGHGGLADAVG